MITFNNTAHARFWAKVNRDGPIHPVHGQCWIWTAARSGQFGYGAFWAGGNDHLTAHRASYALNVGDPCDRSVLHRCDDPPCVRPDHLFLGTQKDNIDDMHSKGREARGEKHGATDLTAGMVVDIRTRRASGEALAAVAAEFGISQASVWGIEIGKRWGHVGGPIGARRKIKITDDMVALIREFRRNGLSAATTASAVGVSKRAVNHIWRGSRHAEAPSVL